MTTIEVPPEMRARRLAWIEALESGELPQGRGALRTDDGYCCIGVCASKVLGFDDDALMGESVGGRWADTARGADHYYKVEVGLEVTSTMKDHLVSMNDRRKRGFPFIARFLRKAWGL